MKIVTCKEFNQEGRKKYRNAVDEWKEGKRERQPFIGIYMYDKNYGYVAKTKTGSRWAKTKSELVKKYGVGGK